MSKATPRKKPMQERSKATVAAIVEAATQLLAAEGYHNLSTNRIAEFAGVSVGSLYQYFPNKDAVVAAVVEAFAERQLQLIVAHLSSFDEDTDIEAGVRTVIAALFEAKKCEPELSRVLFEGVPQIGQVDMLGMWTERAVEVVKAALILRADAMRPLDIDTVAYVIVTACHGIVHTTVIKNPEMLQSETLAQETASLVLRYILPDR